MNFVFSLLSSFILLSSLNRGQLDVMMPINCGRVIPLCLTPVLSENGKNLRSFVTRALICL